MMGTLLANSSVKPNSMYVWGIIASTKGRVIQLARFDPEYAPEHLFNDDDSSTHHIVDLFPSSFQQFKLLGLINQFDILTSYLIV